MTGTGALTMAGLCAQVGKAETVARRVRPTDSAWPTESDWRTLGETVGGALVKPTSMWAHCDGGDRAACAANVKLLFNPYYIGDQAGGTQVFGYLDAWHNAPSAYAIAARSAADVAAGIKFAQRHSLRLVVKGGGHSYFGGSNAADSLLIWTHQMREITLHEEFVPQGCGGQGARAVTVEAGALWMSVYDRVTSQAGRYVQGGGCTTVGVAGLVTGGGFGSFSKRYGLAAASLLQAEVVTADGRIRTVNTCRDPDLFWALKGGGGSAVAVVTKLTLKTHDLPHWFGSFGGRIKATSDLAFRHLIEHFLGFYKEALFNPHWGEQASFHPTNDLEISMVCQDLDAGQIDSVWAPFLTWIAGRPDDYKITEPLEGGVRTPRTWWDARARKAQGSTALKFDDRPGAPVTNAWWAGDSEQVSAFFHGYDSVWLSQSLLSAENSGGLVDAVFKASRSMAVGLHFNKGLAGAPPEALAAARHVATNPDVMDAFALAIVATGGPPPPLLGENPDMTIAHHNALAVAAAAAALRFVAPRSGSYVSEASFFNPDWSYAFWGQNYPRLRGIKARYDPGGLFFVHNGVGSEDWSPDGFERRSPLRDKETIEARLAEVKKIEAEKAKLKKRGS